MLRFCVAVLWTPMIAVQAQQPADPAAPAADFTVPDDDVMRPTERGLRLTPAMARSLAHVMSEKITTETTLSRDRYEQLSHNLARRMMTFGHTHGREVSVLAESLGRAMIVGRGQIPPEMTVEIGQLGEAAMPGLSELVAGMIEDARSAVGEAGRERLDEAELKARERLEQLGGQLERWSNGQREEGERLGTARPSQEPRERARPPEIERAARAADRDLRRMGPVEWRDFLRDAERTFGFDEKQTADAEKLLASYEERAKTVTTDDWRERVRRNREHYHLRDNLRDRPLGPWLYHLGREYDELLSPVDELGRSFRQEVLSLATPAQREAALAALQDFAKFHGLTTEETSLPSTALSPDKR